MLLKPRIATSIVMIFSGAFFGIVGMTIASHIGGVVSLMPAAFGMLGIFWLAVGGLTLSRRASLGIRIEQEGIELPPPSIFQTASRRIMLRKEDIASITKQASLKGRVIEIALKTEEKKHVQARHYCDLDDFLRYCREKGLPA